MALPQILQNLRIPAFGAPLFIVQNPDLVLAQCKAGIPGCFPALNAREKDGEPIELARLQQNCIRYTDFAHIVHRCRIEDDIGFVIRETSRLGKNPGIMTHANDVQAGFIVLVFGGAAKTLNNFQARFMELPCAFLHPGFQFAMLVIQSKLCVSAGQNDGWTHRLGDVIHRSHLQSFLLVFYFAHRGDKNHWYGTCTGIGFEFLTDLVAVHARHHDVEQDDVRRVVRRGSIEGLLPVERDFDTVVFAQNAVHHVDVIRRVIYHQHCLFAYLLSHTLSFPRSNRRSRPIIPILTTFSG